MLQNIDNAASSNHDVLNEVQLSNDTSKSLLSSDNEHTAKENKVCHSFSKYFL